MYLYLSPSSTNQTDEAARIKAAAAEKAAKQRALAERSEAERRALDEAARKSDAEAEVSFVRALSFLSLVFYCHTRLPPSSLAAPASTFFEFTLKKPQRAARASIQRARSKFIASGFFCACRVFEGGDCGFNG